LEPTKVLERKAANLLKKAFATAQGNRQKVDYAHTQLGHDYWATDDILNPPIDISNESLFISCVHVNYHCII